MRLPERGQRALIVGQTGSGKTIGAIRMLQKLPLYPVVIMDTKGEPAFDRIAKPGEDIAKYRSGLEFRKGWLDKVQPGYTIVRPTGYELSEPLDMDDILRFIYDVGRPCVIYIDESYQWHDNGRAGPGLIGLLTRGRSKGFTTIMSTQRPSWISRFCFSESQHYYIFKIVDRRDIKTIEGFIPDFEKHYKSGEQKKHCYIYYDNSADGQVKVCQPVDLPPKRHDIDEKGKLWI